MVQTLVFNLGEQRYGYTGLALPRSAHETEQTISQGLALRLLAYAAQRMADAGLTSFTVNAVTVETCDGDLPSPERAFSVAWENAEGTQIGVQGILTRRGWPCVDHGLFLHA